MLARLYAEQMIVQDRILNSKNSNTGIIEGVNDLQKKSARTKGRYYLCHQPHQMLRGRGVPPGTDDHALYP